MMLRFALRRLACAGLLVHAGLAGAMAADAADVPTPGWALRMAGQDAVAFHGLAGGEAGGAPGMMMYPAPHPLVFLAGLAVHGVIESASQASAKEKQRAAEDKVLEPYRASLAGFRQQDLALAALPMSKAGPALLLQGQETAPSVTTVHSAPAFYLTQERDALVLENTVAVARPGAKPYQRIVLVVSEPRSGDDLEAYWGAQQAQKLKTESADMLARSLDIALADTDGVAAAGNAPYRTIRYAQGKREIIERAQLLSEHCGRILLRSLRGWLMSVPSSKPAGDDASCAERPAI
jgi:hypothetical protein